MNVKLVQERLNEVMNADLEIDGIVGPETITITKSFQKDFGLRADGIIGPNTLAKLFPLDFIKDSDTSLLKKLPEYQYDQSLAERAAVIALSQNGVREKTGHNDGQAVEIFLSAVGLIKGNAWCMAFVYWCYDIAACSLFVPNPLIRTGGVLDQWNRITFKGDAKAFSIFIIDLSHDNAGHCGIVTQVKEDRIITIEGNTNNDGSSNGNGVYIRERAINSIKGFINIK